MGTLQLTTGTNRSGWDLESAGEGQTFALLLPVILICCTSSLHNRAWCVPAPQWARTSG